MTAEIAIANKAAVALAADSKVTIGGSRNAKTYDSVNKVFTLSKTQPVGIMIFGNAEFMEYPWETIIKLYRREFGNIERDYIKDWSDNFQKYLGQFGSIDQSNKKNNTRAMLRSWLFQIEDDAMSKAMTDGIAIPSDGYTDVLIQSLEKYKKAIKSQDMWLSKAKAQSFLKIYGECVVLSVKDVFDIDNKNPIFKACIEFCAAALFSKFDSPQSSGFVIAGFGNKEIFPAVVEHNTDGYIGNNIKIRREDIKEISRNRSGYVGAFAQKDMIQSFMNGFDHNLILKLTGSISEILDDSCLTVLDTYGLKSKKNDKIKSEIRKAAKARVDQLVADFVNESRERFSGPVVEMVSLLPKDELAHLAESLVALTSLRRRVSREIETVGGPVDVALISKGDGFVWIKRKHYFKSDINPQFVRTYMDDVRKEQGS